VRRKRWIPPVDQCDAAVAKFVNHFPRAQSDSVDKEPKDDE
jgi:hypothetical protein